MLSRRRILSYGLLTATLWPGRAPAAETLGADDQRLVDLAVAYLQGLTTAKGRFTQVDPRGRPSSGVFYLQRPGRARFDYDPPSGVVIASDGHEVTEVDRRLKTIESYPLGLTPLKLFLAKDIRLDRGVQVMRVIKQDGAFTVVAREAGGRTTGTIALDFADAPIALTGWTLTDARGGQVKVKLQDFAPADPRPSGFFQLADPRPAVPSEIH